MQQESQKRGEIALGWGVKERFPEEVSWSWEVKVGRVWQDWDS